MRKKRSTPFTYILNGFPLPPVISACSVKAYVSSQLTVYFDIIKAGYVAAENWEQDC